MKHLETENKEWGFYGTLQRTEFGECTEDAWDAFFDSVMQITRFSEADIREFLDSKWGRHMADETYDALTQSETVRAAVDKVVIKRIAFIVERIAAQKGHRTMGSAAQFLRRG